MKISKNSVASIHYTLTDDQNRTIDSSSGGEPLVYLHGSGNIIPGLEEALEGKATGEKFKVSIPAEKAYGERRDDMVQSLPIDQFPDASQIKPGVQFRAQSHMGPVILTVVEVKGDDVVVDGNHPLAGQTLHFEVEVAEVRAATSEELDHGHVHGAGGHQH